MSQLVSLIQLRSQNAGGNESNALAFDQALVGKQLEVLWPYTDRAIMGIGWVGGPSRSVRNCGTPRACLRAHAQRSCSPGVWRVCELDLDAIGIEEVSRSAVHRDLMEMRYCHLLGGRKHLRSGIAS